MFQYLADSWQTLHQERDASRTANTITSTCFQVVSLYVDQKLFQSGSIHYLQGFRREMNHPQGSPSDQNQHGTVDPVIKTYKKY